MPYLQISSKAFKTNKSKRLLIKQQTQTKCLFQEYKNMTFGWRCINRIYFFLIFFVLFF